MRWVGKAKSELTVHLANDEECYCSNQGMRVLGLSLITNKVISTPYRNLKAEVAAEYAKGQQAKKAPLTAEEKEETTSHEEVLEVGRQAAEEMSSLVAKIVELAGLTL